jgi:hypothetical protein
MNPLILEQNVLLSKLQPRQALMRKVNFEINEVRIKIAGQEAGLRKAVI